MGDGHVALILDVLGLAQVEEQAYESAPETLDERHREFIRGVYKLQNRLLLLLDTAKAASALQAQPA